MSTSIFRTKEVFNRLEKIQKIGEWAAEVKPLTEEEIVQIDSVPPTDPYTEQGRQNRLKMLEEGRDIELPYLKGDKKFDDFDELKGHIEDFIGMIQLPVGIAGPLVVNGTSANGNYMIPLATTEGALVASYNRGMKACRLSGGITSICIVEGIQRCPLFEFESISQAGEFIHWILQQLEVFDLIVEEKSRFCYAEGGESSY